MWTVKCHALGAASAVVLWLAASAAWAQTRRLDGVWRVEFSGNQFCYAPHGTVRWTIRKGKIVTQRGYRGTVDPEGRIRARYPGPYFGKMNAVFGRLAGNQGTGSVFVEGTRCSLAIKLTRLSG